MSTFLLLKQKTQKHLLILTSVSDGANLMLYYKYTVQEKKIGTTKFQKTKIKKSIQIKIH